MDAILCCCFLCTDLHLCEHILLHVDCASPMCAYACNVLNPPTVCRLVRLRDVVVPKRLEQYLAAHTFASPNKDVKPIYGWDAGAQHTNDAPHNHIRCVCEPVCVHARGKL